MGGLTLDASALIGVERGDRSLVLRVREAGVRNFTLTVPTVVIAEAWRGGARSAPIALLLKACVVEPLHEDLAKLAGEAVAASKGATIIDAIVMASAARRGDRVLTADVRDSGRLHRFFPGVRVMRM